MLIILLLSSYMKSSSEYEILTSQIFNDYITKNEENTIKYDCQKFCQQNLKTKLILRKAIKMCECPFN